MTKRVLIICTSHDKLGDTDEATGSWAEEIMAPYYVFKHHGYDVTIASIKGGEIPVDDASLNPPFATKEVEQGLLDDACMSAIMNSKPISDVSADGYDAIFVPGGHGTCYDLPDNEKLIQILESAYASGKVVSAVCHGSGAFANVKGPDGKPMVAGKKVTGFSDAEEYAVAKEKLVPFLLETKLKELGGLYECAKEKWAVHVVRDGHLITGQNPGSSKRTAEVIVEALS